MRVAAMAWQVVLGIVMLAASLVPSWLIDLSQAPTEYQIRFWTTAIVAVALWGIARRITFFRWFLLLLLGTGVVASVWSFIRADTIEVESVLITLVQVVALALLFTPGANRWFAARTGQRETV